jgi:hypothetical protein
MDNAAGSSACWGVGKAKGVGAYSFAVGGRREEEEKIKTNLEILKYTLPRRPYLPVLFPTQPFPGQERPFDEKA